VKSQISRLSYSFIFFSLLSELSAQCIVANESCLHSLLLQVRSVLTVFKRDNAWRHMKVSNRRMPFLIPASCNICGHERGLRSCSNRPSLILCSSSSRHPPESLPHISRPLPTSLLHAPKLSGLRSRGICIEVDSSVGHPVNHGDKGRMAQKKAVRGPRSKRDTCTEKRRESLLS